MTDHLDAAASWHGPRMSSGRDITGGPIEIVVESDGKATFTDADGNALSFIEAPASGN
jgi:hypothetical protein